jgi:hypothetical protein
MADAVETQVLYESASEYIAKFTNVSDGTGEADVVKVDVSALSPSCAEVDIVKIVYSTDGMAVRVEWDATTDTVAWLIPANQSDTIDFSKDTPGRIRNNAGSGKTGDVLFTTVGHTLGDSYSIILHCRKRQTAEV